ncbi:hypothetical protein [Pelagibaculum spongiae]|uniref:Uncharacterized protein n=1 Tax=Pelagibaculum spongiae TaxID=2080658 RepID=A0A2V1H576_9GAMM|nr:hypothetical protein [Pelagibaculum spongiae]PVZ71572.1 hypothetical protein DC094_00580 [Pelagibaculum spongiae]
MKCFHHSSYFGNAAIAFAGGIRIENGIVTGISNNSGHYKPTLVSLKLALLALRHHGIDLTKVEVNLTEGGGSNFIGWGHEVVVSSEELMSEVEK